MRGFWAGFVLCLGAIASGQGLFGGMHWRLVGPFRGGRALTACGVPGSPETFLFGAVGGGVWKSVNAGRTWVPIFDSQPTASIGAIAVAPSDPQVIYVGSGEADMRSDIQQGNGMYRSGDGGKTWTHIGLVDSRQIGKILVDPHDPETVYVAALGHQYGPNSERGVFKSTDGGKTWVKSLYENQDTGAIDLEMDPSDPNVIFAAMWQTRRPPWSVYPPSMGPGSGLYKTTDGGASWTQIKGGGLPGFVGRISISICPSQPQRVYLCVDTNSTRLGGVYRSDNGGSTWSHTSDDPRIWGRGWYFTGITADPKNPDQVYVMNTSAYRSTDGGKTFTAFKGAPGGDDYHSCWIAPDDPSRMIVATDQGTVVSVDGGKTWSSWYNQPTGQFYHVVTDNRFPYWVYGSQQDSGAMALPSRTIHTGIGALYQRPIDAGGESGTIAPDPLHPGLLFSSGGSKEQIETGWEQNIDPTLARMETEWRSEWTMPIVVSPANKRVVYTSHQQIFRTSNGGESWRVISPDLTRKKNTIPTNLDPVTAKDDEGKPRPGVVYWIAPSPLKAKEIWAGTDDGLIWLTRDDGLHWKDVTPAALTPWSKVGIIDAGHFSTETAYAAIDRHRLDDNRPYIYRTHDGGRHWTLITNGIPRDQFVNVVREDPKQKGLLYAGTDWGVFVSFDDGGHWRSLQINLPAASVRDIVFGGNDVVIGTHGRANWILDDVSRLRQIAVAPRTTLFKPAPAIIFQRAGTFGFGQYDEGTPLPPEEPQGENPAWGAVIDYSLRVASRVDLTILDSHGKVLRRISSTDAVPTVDVNKLSIPAYWVRPGKILSGEAGGHRYLWDFRYESPGGPMVPPGTYVCRLTVTTQGHAPASFNSTLVVQRDPRLPVTDADLRAQFKMALEVLGEIKYVTGLIARTKKPAVLARLKMALGGLERLEGAIESAPAAPTAEYRLTFRKLKKMAG